MAQAHPPLPQAGPNAVRAYLSDILIHKHDLPAEPAQSTAALWQLGRGDDLRTANSTDFIRIFGDPDGWFLYRSVVEDLYAEWRASTAGIINWWMLAVVGVAVVVFIVQACRASEDGRSWRKLTHALFCAPVILVGAVLELMHSLHFVFILVATLSGIISVFSFFRFLEVVTESRDERPRQDKDGRKKDE